MQSRPVARGRVPQPNLPGEGIEGAVHLALVQSIAVLIQKKQVSVGLASKLSRRLRTPPAPCRWRGCRGTRRDLLNFVSRMVRTPSDQSISPVRIFSASLKRSPVTTNVPNRQ